MSTPDIKVLSLEEIRERVQARKNQSIDLSSLKTFEHPGLGGTVHYGPIPSIMMHRYENIAQYYPLDYHDPAKRGQKSSTPELDQSNRERLLLRYGIWTQDAKQLSDGDVEWLLNDSASGPYNRRLALLIEAESFYSKSAQREEEENRVATFTRWEAAFHDLLVKSGLVKHWVEYVNSSDLSTPESREAAETLLKLEAAAPEWSRLMQAEEIIKSLRELPA